jgi:O-antigen ligase
VAIIGMAQHLFGLNLLPQAAAPSATFGNKNMAVHLLVLILPLGIALCLTQQRRLALLLPISLALVSTYLIYTQTRGGWLAVIIELVLFIIMIRRLQAQGRLSLGRQRKRGMAMGLILFLLLAGLGPGFSFQGYSLLGKRLAQTKEQATTTQGQVRLAYWANSLAMIREHPLLGTGLGNFKVHYPHYYNAVIDDWSFGNIRQTTTPHNDLIQLMVELGLGGLFLGIWLLGKMIYLGLRNGQRLPDERAIYAGALAIALVGCLINSQFSFPMQRTIPPFFAMICLALLSNILLVDRQIVVSPKRISIYALLALLCLVRLGPYQYGAWQANRLLMETILLTEAGQWQEAMDRGRQSWQSQPAKTRPILTYLGKAALRAGQPRAAEQCFTTLLADYPANINDLASLGTVYAVQGRNDEAMAMFEKSIAIYGENWGAYNNMGYMFMGRQLYGKAQKAFVQAASLRPGSAKLWHNVALAAEKTGDMEMARKAGQKIKELEEKGKTEP